VRATRPRTRAADFLLGLTESGVGGVLTGLFIVSASLRASDSVMFSSRVQYWTSRFSCHFLEPIQEEWIHEQRFGLVKRLSMMRIIARRTKAATVPA
jgi:hypothetical protein